MPASYGGRHTQRVSSARGVHGSTPASNQEVEPAMIESRRDGAVAVVTLDRHATRNSLDAEVCTALREAVEAADAAAGDVEDPVRAIVITGAGTAFCAGADLSGGVYTTDFYDAHAAMLRAVETADVPVVAAVNGPAIGAGVQLALAADLRVVAPGAVFAVPVVKVGLALDNWTIKRLANVVGGGHARSVLMTARPVGAEEAARIGLANEIGDLDAAMEMAAEVADFAPLTLRHIKSVVNDDDARLLPRDEHTELQHRAWHSADMAQARAARAEKRAPRLRGRRRHECRTGRRRAAPVRPVLRRNARPRPGADRIPRAVPPGRGTARGVAGRRPAPASTRGERHPMSARHSAEPQGNPTARRVVLVGAVLLVAALVIGLALAVLSRLGPAGLCGDREEITVAAEPGGAHHVEALADASARWHTFEGTEVSSSDMAARTASREDFADLWVPDSAVRLAQVSQQARIPFDTVLNSIASTPVILATRDARVDLSTWTSALATPGLAMGDPVRSGIADAPILAASSEVENMRSTSDALGAAMAALAQGPAGRTGAAPSERALLEGVIRSGGAAVVSERQAVLAVRDAPDAGIELAAPSTGVVFLDHPLAVTTQDPTRRDAAAEAAEGLRDATASSDFAAGLADDGFRTADRTPLADGEGIGE